MESRSWGRDGPQLVSTSRDPALALCVRGSCPGPPTAATLSEGEELVGQEGVPSQS